MHTHTHAHTHLLLQHTNKCWPPALSRDFISSAILTAFVIVLTLLAQFCECTTLWKRKG